MEYLGNGEKQIFVSMPSWYACNQCFHSLWLVEDWKLEIISVSETSLSFVMTLNILHISWLNLSLLSKATREWVKSPKQLLPCHVVLICVQYFPQLSTSDFAVILTFIGKDKQEKHQFMWSATVYKFESVALRLVCLIWNSDRNPG